MLLPLWAGYLVKIYAWRIILAQGGLLEWFLGLFGQAGLNPGLSEPGMVIAFCYLWLPYMILPIYAGLERIPPSVLEASADLGGRGWMTFRRVVLPLVLPAVAAGSIFTFSLTLGDYVTPQLIANTRDSSATSSSTARAWRTTCRSPRPSHSSRSRSWRSTCWERAGSARSNAL